MKLFYWRKGFGKREDWGVNVGLRRTLTLNNSSIFSPIPQCCTQYLLFSRFSSWFSRSNHRRGAQRKGPEPRSLNREQSATTVCNAAKTTITAQKQEMGREISVCRVKQIQRGGGGVRVAIIDKKKNYGIDNVLLAARVLEESSWVNIVLQ